MQDLSVTAAAWITPDFAQFDPFVSADSACSALDEDALAQFEAMLPQGLGERADDSCVDSAESGGIAGGVGGVNGSGGAGSASATSQGEAGGRPTEPRALQADAIVSSYTIHHARIGVVHVQQSVGAGGAVGTLALRTDDDELRSRLRDAMPALRSALADCAGQEPTLSVDA